MLDLKVFTHKYVSVKKPTDKEVIELIQNCEGFLPKEHIDIYVESYNKYSLLYKNKSTKKVELKDVDKVFEFSKEDFKNYTKEKRETYINYTDAEYNRYTEMCEYLKRNYNPLLEIVGANFDLSAAFNLIQLIRRNEELEKAIIDFRESDEVKKFKKEIKKKRPRQQYYNICLFNENSNLFQYFKVSKYRNANEMMMPEIEKKITKIFNDYNMIETLKIIFSDLIFWGIIPLEKIVYEPLHLTYNSRNNQNLKIEITNNVITEKEIIKFIKENKDTIRNLLKRKYEYRKLSQNELDVFDLSKQKPKLKHSAIVGIINDYRNFKKLKEPLSRTYLKNANRTITSIFYPKN